MIAGLLLSLATATAAPPCENLAEERAALLRATSSDQDVRNLAVSLDRKYEAPLSHGIPMDGSPAEVAGTLVDRLEAFCARARAHGGAATRAGDREALGEILDRPEFARARTPDTGGGLERLAQWLTDWLETLFATTGAQTFARGTRVLVLALALALALGVALRLVASRRKAAPGEAEAPRHAPITLDSPDAHLARAGAALESDSREAIREALFALLSSLERRALARPDRVKTNREVAEQLAERGAAPRLSEQVGSLLGWYDRTYYSLERPAAPEARRFVDDVAALARALRGGVA